LRRSRLGIGLRPGGLDLGFLLLARLFLGHVAADNTATDSANHGMVAGNVARDSAYGCTLDASRRIRRAAGQCDTGQ
jgi:hypothetical protein